MATGEIKISELTLKSDLSEDSSVPAVSADDGENYRFRLRDLMEILQLETGQTMVDLVAQARAAVLASSTAGMLLYPTTAAGITATVSGDYFYTINADGGYNVWRNTAGTAIFQTLLGDAASAKAWAESPTAPGDVGTKSAKTHAAEAQASAAILGAMPTQTIAGRASAGTGAVENLTPLAIRAMLDLIRQASPSDTTAGRLLVPGSFGLGGLNPPLLVDANSPSTPAGFYYTTPTTLNSGSLPASPYGFLRVWRFNSVSCMVEYTTLTAGPGVVTTTVYSRKYNGTTLAWEPWSAPLMVSEKATAADIVTGTEGTKYLTASALAGANIAPAMYPTRVAALAAVVPATILKLSVYHGRHLCDYVRGTPSAITTNGGTVNWRPASTTATFQHFGADGDGVVDDTVAVTAAINSELAFNNPVLSAYRVSGALSFTDKRVSIENGVLITQGVAAAANAVQFHYNTLKTLFIDNFGFFSAQNGNNHGLAISWAEALTDSQRHQRYVFLGDNIRIGGVDNLTNYYLTALKFVNVNRPAIGKIHIYGKKDTGGKYVVGTNGITIGQSGVAQPVGYKLTDVVINGVETCVQSSQVAEGLSLTGCDLINCGWGVVVDWDEGAASFNPGLWIVDCHINARMRCIKANNVYEFTIRGNEFYCFPNQGGVDTWYGVEMISCGTGVIGPNFMQGNPSGSLGGIARLPGILNNCNSIWVTNNDARGCSDRWYVIGTTPAAGSEIRFENNIAQGLLGALGTSQSTPATIAGCKYKFDWT